MARPGRIGRPLLAASLVLATLALIVVSILLYQPRWLISELAERSPGVLYYVETRRPVVALTIDDGPDPETTPAILRVLARHRARATFFLIGARARALDSLVSRIVREGHELGNHLARDRTSVRLSAAEFEAGLVETHRTLARFGPVRWLRPGGGWYDDTILTIAAKHGYRCALGSVYPYDAAIPWSDFAVFHVVRSVRAGSIIVLHDGGGRGRRTARTLSRVLPELRDRGFEVVTLSELVETARVRAGPAARQSPASSGR